MGLDVVGNNTALLSRIEGLVRNTEMMAEALRSIAGEDEEMTVSQLCARAVTEFRNWQARAGCVEVEVAMLVDNANALIDRAVEMGTEAGHG
jgi:hypothetical protein